MSNANAGSNWAARGKAATKAVPLTKSNPVDRGTRHQGVVETFTPIAYKTGSFGVAISYTVEGLERKVYENIVLRKLNAKGDLEPTQYGESTLKRRLQAFGLDSDAINAFPIPRTPKDENDAYNFQGTPVAIYLTDEMYLDRPQKRVKSVFPLDG